MGVGEMIIKDVYPSKAQFKKGEKIEIIAELEGTAPLNTLRCRVYKLHEIILVQDKFIALPENRVVFEFDINGYGELSGFGVEIEHYEKNETLQVMYTAFDISDSWRYAPRYGFVSDFSPEDKEDKTDLKQMNKYHLNVVQYYDWMYKHHDLIPAEDVFMDPLNRRLCLSTVKDKIELAHSYGMEAMGYGAVYGAEPRFYEEHKEMAIYKNDGEVFGFYGFLYMMDISRECRWHDLIINEFYKAVKLGFDGIHMDQYGFPKEAVSIADGTKKIRKLKNDFPDLINDTRKYIEGKGEKVNLIFNAVNNWPVETVAGAGQDAVYIEVWPPNDTYQDLYNLITNSKKIAPEKQVILAAYMRPFLEELNIPVDKAENAALLTMAAIFASGGFHLLLGENNGILADPYYPKYRTADNKSFIRQLRNYYDFIVRYEELLFDLDIIDTTMTSTGGINGDYIFNNCKASPKAEANCIWTLVKERPGYKIVNLINFNGIDNMNWNEAKEKAPGEINGIELSVITCHEIKGVFTASPDYNNGAAVELDFEYTQSDQGKAVKFSIPSLKVWDLVYLVY